MMKAVLKLKGREVLVIGLSHANLDKLRSDSDGYIRIQGNEMGLPIDVYVTAGETEQTLADTFSSLIGPDTKLVIDDRLKS